MSRHRLIPHPDQPTTSFTVIGWDRPLQSIFVEIHDTGEDGEDKLVTSKGTAMRELKTAAEAIAAAAPYAEIPVGLSAQLEIDRLQTLGTPDSAHQRTIKRRFGLD